MRGRVQMVMYRDFAVRTARSLSIVGTVQNLEDGSVEIYAEGKENSLTHYVEKLNRGSLLSRVESVDIEWTTPTHRYKDFSITPRGQE